MTQATGYQPVGYFSRIILFLQMIKFEHSIFALPFAYLGLLLGAHLKTTLPAFLYVTLAMVSFRTMAMGLNRLIDHVIDAKNPRTGERALPAKKLSRSYVWIWTAASFFIFEFSAHQLSTLCLKLSLVPVFFAVLYPYAKRFTSFSHFILGIVLGIAPYGAWLASGREFSWIPGFLCLGVICWVAGFDMIYALQDEDFDRENGLHSFPSKFGKQATLRITRLLHLLTVGFWWAAGDLAHLGMIYQGGMILTILFLIREHWLVHSRGLQKIDEAFFLMNAVVSVFVFVAACLDLALSRGVA